VLLREGRLAETELKDLSLWCALAVLGNKEPCVMNLVLVSWFPRSGGLEWQP
jgi:hypothetical protein